MKRILPLVLLLTSLLSATQLTIMTEDWTPYNYKKDGKIKGISTSIVEAIKKKINNTDTINLYPWNRAYKKVLNEKNTILFCMVRNESRENLFKWVGPISENASYLFKKKNNPMNIETIEDAKKVKLIGAGSKNNIDYITLESKGFTNLSTLDTKSNPITLIVNNRVDLGGSNPLTAKFHLKKHNLDTNSIENTGVLVFSKPLYIAFNKDIDQKIIDKWQKALDELNDSGELDKIKEKALKDAYNDFNIEYNR